MQRRSLKPLEQGLWVSESAANDAWMAAELQGLSSREQELLRKVEEEKQVLIEEHK